jgi:MFS transporter, FSR family, fosmidomycin resistance protein
VTVAHRTETHGVRPPVTLTLLSIQHAIIHGQSALYPLVFLAIIQEFGVTVATIALLAAVGNIAAGLLQYAFGALTRRFSRRTLLGVGGLVVGVTTTAQGLVGGFGAFAAANILSRVGGAPQHPVGNALLAEQFPSRRIGFAISAHIAGGNLGTVVVGFAAAAAIATVGWRAAVVVLGVAALAVALAVLAFVRESGADRAHASAAGGVRRAYRQVLADRNLRWLLVSGMVGGGSRGLGVLNVFVPLYLSAVAGLDLPTIGAMYAVLLAASVPGPLVAGWLSDRYGRKRLIVIVYALGAASIVAFLGAGSNVALIWAGIVALSLFSFVESPQLQALLADITEPDLRDAAYSTYFALAFGVGSMWLLLYGWLINAAGDTVGLPAVFWVMAGASVAAGLAVLPIRMPPHRSAEPAP